MWWLKKIRKRKMQSVLIILIVALCTTLISGSFVILTSMTSVYSGLANETGAPDVKVYGRANMTKDSMVEKLSHIDGVREVVVIPKVSVTTIILNNEKKDIFLDICEYMDCVYKNIRILDGSLDSIGENRCALPQAVMNEYGLNIGEEFKVMINEDEYIYQVVCTFAEIYSAATQYTCDMLVEKLPDSVVGKPDLLEEHLLSVSEVYALYLEENMTCDGLIAAYTADNEGIMDGVFRTKSDCIVNAELTELILGGLLLGISSVVFLAILIIISYIVKNSILSDKKTIAIYKTMGYGNNSIRRIYITFYMTLITGGAIIGGVGSPILSSSFIGRVYKNIGATKAAGGLWQIVACVMIICLAAILMLFKETGKVMKMKPVEILNNADEKRRVGKPKKRNHFVFSPTSMAVSMMRRDKKNTLLLLVTCIISIYIVNLSVVCMKNIDLIQGETNYYWLGIDKHDVTFENAGSNKDFYSICEKLREDPDIEQVVRRNYDMGFAIPYHQTTSALVYESFENLDLPVIQGRNPEKPDEVTVGNVYLKELGIEIGDYITIQLSADVRKNLLVVGSFQGFYNMGRGVRLMGELLTENNVLFEYTQCSIVLKDGVDKEAFMSRMRETYGNQIKVIDRLHLYESIMTVVCEPQKAALRPFLALTVIIGVLNTFYIIYASNVEKRKKYTIYKSIGYSSSHLVFVNVIYVGLIALVATVLAVPAFIFLFPKLMVLAMSAFGFAEYRLEIQPLTLIMTNLMMMFLFLGSSALAGFDIRTNYISKLMNE